MTELSEQNAAIVMRVIEGAVEGEIPAVKADMLNALLDAARAEGVETARLSDRGEGLGGPHEPAVLDASNAPSADVLRPGEAHPFIYSAMISRVKNPSQTQQGVRGGIAWSASADEARGSLCAQALADGWSVEILVVEPVSEGCLQRLSEYAKGQEVTASADGALGRQALSVQADPLPPAGGRG